MIVFLLVIKFWTNQKAGSVILGSRLEATNVSWSCAVTWAYNRDFVDFAVRSHSDIILGLHPEMLHIAVLNVVGVILLGVRHSHLSPFAILGSKFQEELRYGAVAVKTWEPRDVDGKVGGQPLDVGWRRWRDWISGVWGDRLSYTIDMRIVLAFCSYSKAVEASWRPQLPQSLQQEWAFWKTPHLLHQIKFLAFPQADNSA